MTALAFPSSSAITVGVMASAGSQALRSLLGALTHIWKARITDGCDILAHQYSRKYFISQCPDGLRKFCSHLWLEPSLHMNASSRRGQPGPSSDQRIKISRGEKAEAVRLLEALGSKVSNFFLLHSIGLSKHKPSPDSRRQMRDKIAPQRSMPSAMKNTVRPAL